MAPPPGCLEHRHRMMRAQKLPGQADIDAASPVGGRDFLDAAGRPGDAGIVDQGIEATESRRDVAEHRCDLIRVRNIGAARRMFRMRGAEIREKRLGHVAHINPRTMRDQHVGNGPADAGRPRRYEHPQTRLQSLEDLLAAADCHDEPPSLTVRATRPRQQERPAHR